jgi:hypothetical protein
MLVFQGDLEIMKQFYDFKKTRTLREAAEFLAFHGCVFALLTVVFA